MHLEEFGASLKTYYRNVVSRGGRYMQESLQIFFFLKKKMRYKMHQVYTVNAGAKMEYNMHRISNSSPVQSVANRKGRLHTSRGQILVTFIMA